MKVSPHPDWATSHRKPGTELRLIKGKYYLYAVSSRYNPEKKKPQKITGKLLGRITQADGFIESDKNKLRQNAQNQAHGVSNKPIAVRELGFSKIIIALAVPVISKLKEVFPNDWALMLSMAYCRLGWQAPIKNIPFLIEQSHLRDWAGLSSFGEKIISDALRRWGSSRPAIVQYMNSFMQEGGFALIDATEIASKSSNISLVEKGYNSRLDYQPQVNLLYLYSLDNSMPVFYRLLGGNIREIKALKNTLLESKLNKAILIADKGFFSAQNIKDLIENELHFIIPVRRNNSAITYNNLEKIEKTDSYFKYQERYIYHYNFEHEGLNYITFMDGRLKEEEKTDYLNRIKTLPEKYTAEKFKEKLDRMGTVTMTYKLEEKNSTAENVYLTYKSRGQIEQMFDGLKNTIDAGSSYMQNEDALQGWMFINHLALQLYYLIQKQLMEAKLHSKLSIKDVVLKSQRWTELRIEDKWIPAEATLHSLKILKSMGVHIT